MIAVEFTIEELRWLKETNNFFRLEHNLNSLDQTMADMIEAKLASAIVIETNR